LYIINNALNETEDAQLMKRHLLIPYLINIFYVSDFTITLSGVGVDWTVRANIGRVWRVGSFQIYQAKKGALVSKYTLIPLVNLTIYIFFCYHAETQLLKKKDT
jgi:hypothetical protein